MQRSQSERDAHPGMVVPFGGENQVVLDTSGMDLAVQNSAI